MNALTRLSQLHDALRARLMLRSMLAVIGVASLIGVLVVSASFFVLRANEQKRLYAGLEELMSATEGAASVATFALDATLARQVINGLFANPAVARVAIRSDEQILISMHRPGTSPAAVGQPLTHKLASPFDKTQIIGVLEVYPQDEQVRAAAADSATLIALLLALELVGVAGSVGWVVFSKVTRPIQTVAQDLHRLQLESGGLIWPPRGNEHDEIGQLVSDVNLMIARMQGMLLSERDMRDEMEVSERKFRLIFENAEAGIFVLDEAARLQSWNPAMTRMLGEETFAHAFQPPNLAYLLGCPPAQVEALIKQALSAEGAAGADFERISHSGASEHFHLVFNPISGGRLQGVCNDISERKRAEARASSLAERDALTGLLNRRGFESHAGALLKNAGSLNGVAALMIDLDGFKEVNDSFGHEAGDAVLRHVARLLERSVRKNDLLARLGGDEFVLMLCSQTSSEPARAVAAKINSGLAAPIFTAEEESAKVGASIGIALSFDADETLEALLRRADQAMYAVKRSGKNDFRLAPGSEA